MKKSLLLFISVLCIVSNSYSQSTSLPALPSGWERIYIKDIGSFDLPPTMEIQAGKYKQLVNEFYRRMEYDAPQLVAQQKGLNEFGKVGFGKYARVMIETTLSTPGEYEKLNFSISKITPTEIRELNSSLKEMIQNEFIGTGLKLIEWYPVKVETINGMSCIHVNYLRQLQDKPNVFVHMYVFYNYDRMHTFTLSYRLSEADYWKSNYSMILKSFRITNIK